jgi:hypothetical protein
VAACASGSRIAVDPAGPSWVTVSTVTSSSGADARIASRTVRAGSALCLIGIMRGWSDTITMGDRSCLPDAEAQCRYIGVSCVSIATSSGSRYIREAQLKNCSGIRIRFQFVNFRMLAPWLRMDGRSQRDSERASRLNYLDVLCMPHFPFIASSFRSPACLAMKFERHPHSRPTLSAFVC